MSTIVHLSFRLVFAVVVFPLLLISAATSFVAVAAAEAYEIAYSQYYRGHYPNGLPLSLLKNAVEKEWYFQSAFLKDELRRFKCNHKGP